MGQWARFHRQAIEVDPLMSEDESFMLWIQLKREAGDITAESARQYFIYRAMTSITEEEAYRRFLLRESNEWERIGLQVLRPTTSAYLARKSGGPTNGNDHDGGGEDGSTRPGSGRVDSTDRAVFPDSGEMDYEGSGRDGVSRSKFDWLQRLLEKEDWFDFTLRETCGIGICRHQSRPRVRASNSSTQVPTDDVVLHTAGNLDDNEANLTTGEFITDDLKLDMWPKNLSLLEVVFDEYGYYESFSDWLDEVGVP